MSSSFNHVYMPCVSIFASGNSPATIPAEFPKKPGGAAVLITTRNKNWIGAKNQGSIQTDKYESWRQVMFMGQNKGISKVSGAYPPFIFFMQKYKFLIDKDMMQFILE